MIIVKLERKESLQHEKPSRTFENLRMHNEKWPTVCMAIQGGTLDLGYGAVSEKIPQIFWLSFSGRTEAPDVRCDLTDTQTDTATIVTLAAHARRGLKMKHICERQDPGCPAQPWNTHTNTHTLSLSLTHTHTHTHTPPPTCSRGHTFWR